jgi:hypothetical protein
MDGALVDGWAIFLFWTKKLSIGFSELILGNSRFLRFSVTRFHKNFRYLIVTFSYIILQWTLGLKASINLAPSV